MPVRDALRRLRAVGLVEIVPHKGAWVPPMTIDDLIDTYFTRLHLECLAIATAATRFGEGDAAVARAAMTDHDEARRCKDAVGMRRASERFHFALYDASGSQWLTRSIVPSWRNSERYRIASMRDVKRAGEHASMLEAVERHDGVAAVSILAEHLTSSATLVARGLDRSAGDLADRLPSAEGILRGVGR